MQIRVGYDLSYECAQPVPMIVMLNIHYSRASDLIQPDHIRTDPPVPLRSYRDDFGNWCTRLVAPPGRIRLTTDVLVREDLRIDQPKIERSSKIANWQFG